MDHGSTTSGDTTPLASPYQSPNLQCCCGRLDCIFLKKNCTALTSLENDVHRAGKLGKDLLERHQAYMADAERDRAELTSRILQLEMDKRELEAQNAKTIEENRTLLDQLEMLNTTVTDSDTRIRSLEASLQSSQLAVRRLENATARAADMERHIAALEEEQARLQNTLLTTEEDARSAMYRWRKAERGITDLQDQLERMEKEAREEREKHVEMLGRVERQREMEKELNTAAGRLKGAAAVKSLGGGPAKSGSSVVSHFVRDLLQDNANLQLGIAELREMLNNSNDEVHALREQLLFHQPADEDEGQASGASTLRAELDAKEPEPKTPLISQQLHIHHHYHATTRQDSRKPKKKRRSGLAPGTFTPPAMSTPSTPGLGPGYWRLGPSPAAPALLSHSASGRETPSAGLSNRWSVLSEQPSEFAPSSVPSSPLSAKRNSMFDRGMLDMDGPTSPTTSIDPASPTWRAGQGHRKRVSDVSVISFQPQPPQATTPVPIPTASAHGRPLEHPIHEEDDFSEEPTPELTSATEESGEESSNSREDVDDFNPPRRLHRALSHESIMSLSGGLDIHTLKSRPSQLTLRTIGGADTVLCGASVQTTAFRSGDRRGYTVLRDSLGGSSTPRQVSTPLARSPDPNSGFSRWKPWRLWGGSPAEGTVSSKTDKDQEPEPLRSPGINQPGAIPGLLAAQRRQGAPAKVVADNVDHQALKEVLEG